MKLEMSEHKECLISIHDNIYLLSWTTQSFRKLHAKSRIEIDIFHNPCIKFVLQDELLTHTKELDWNIVVKQSQDIRNFLKGASTIVNN